MEWSKRLSAIGILLHSFFMFAADRVDKPIVHDLLLKATFQLEQGYCHQNMALIDQALSQLEPLLNHEGFVTQAHYYSALAEYRAINVMNITDQRDEKAHLRRIDRAIKHLESIIKANPDHIESLVLLYSFYSRKIGLKPLSGVSLFSKMEDVRDAAKQLDPNHPRLMLIQAIYDYHAPKRFGGDRLKAHMGFAAAANLLSRQVGTDPLAPHWGFEDACSWLGISYLDDGKDKMAYDAFRRGLDSNPQFAWIKNDLIKRVAPVTGSLATSGANGR